MSNPQPADPAVEAAKRAWVVPRGRWALPYFDPDNRLESCYILAAREALKPIQEMHHRYIVKATSCDEDCSEHDGDCPTDVDVAVCWECYRFASDDIYPYFCEENLQAVEWPCVTAELIYAEGEL